MKQVDIKAIENKIISGKELTEDELKRCSWGEVGKYIEEKEGESGRWTKTISTIFELNGQLYCIDWEQGLTECQENEYWEQPYKVRREEKEVTTTIVSYVKMED